MKKVRKIPVMLLSLLTESKKTGVVYIPKIKDIFPFITDEQCNQVI